MKFLTKENIKQLPKLGVQEGKGMEAIAFVKFFCPWGSWTWYATEYDPTQGLFFGMVDGFEKEIGYFSLEELQSVSGPWGLKIERDLWWKPTKLIDIK